jgi:hypothetical protein
MGEMRNAYKILIGKPEGKRPLGRQRSRWEDNIKMALKNSIWRCGLSHKFFTFSNSKKTAYSISYM